MLFPIILFLSIIITTYNRGFFSLPAFAVLCSLVILLFYSFYVEVKYFSAHSKEFTSRMLLTLVFLITYTLFLFNSSGIYEMNSSLSFFLTFLPLLFFPLVLTYAISHPSLSQSSQKKRYVRAKISVAYDLFPIRYSPTALKTSAAIRSTLGSLNNIINGV